VSLRLAMILSLCLAVRLPVRKEGIPAITVVVISCAISLTRSVASIESTDLSAALLVSTSRGRVRCRRDEVVVSTLVGVDDATDGAGVRV
jgi:hypothetical protein